MNEILFRPTRQVIAKRRTADDPVKRKMFVNWAFNDKVALVTGAASGIGLATAKAFAEAGAAIALADVHEDAVRSAAEELVSAGHEAIAVRCNVADESDVAAMVEQTVSTFGRLDAAFNNARVQSPAVESADASDNQHWLLEMNGYRSPAETRRNWMAAAVTTHEAAMTDHEACAGAAKPENGRGDLLGLAKPPNRLISQDLFHRVWFGQHLRQLRNS